MLWLTWRQHRVELVSALVLLAALAVPLIMTGLDLRAEFRSSGVAECIANGGDRGCASLVEAFLDRHTEWGNRFVWAMLLPALAALVGTGVVGVAGLCAVLLTWWRTPLDDVGGRLRTAALVVAAPSLTAVTLFAFALGVLAGTLFRRAIPAWSPPWSRT